MRVKRLTVLLAAMTLGLCAPAPASVSVAAGGFTQDRPSKSGGAIILSSGSAIPAVPVEIEGSLLIPAVSGAGYAATAEIRGFTGGGFGGAYVGAGAGVGNLTSDRTTGAIFTAFAGKAVAPFTSIELRIYRSTAEKGATSGFLGVRFSI